MTGEERRDLEREARIARALRQRPRDLRIPSFTAVETRLRRRTPLPVVLATSAAAIVLALVIGNAVAERRAGTPAASSAPALTPVTATPSTPATTATAPTSLLSDRFGFVWVDEPRGLQVKPETGGSVSTLAALPYGFNDCGCKVSPDGTRIAYWTTRMTPETAELRVLDLSRPTQPTTIYTAPSGQRISGAAWSSDGTGILFAVEGVNPPGSPVGSPPDTALLATEAGGGPARTLDRDAGEYVPLGWDRTAGVAAAALSGEGGYMFGYVTVRTSGDPAPRQTAVTGSIFMMSVEVSSDQRYALGVFFEQGQPGGTVRWWRLTDFAPTTTGGPLVDAPMGVKWRPGTAEVAWIEGDSLELLDVESGRRRIAGSLPSTGYRLAAFRHDGSAVAATRGSATVVLEIATGRSERITGPGHIVGAVRSHPSASVAGLFFPVMKPADVVPQALMPTGSLVLRDNCLWLEPDGRSPAYLILWPAGSNLREVDGTISIYDQSGARLATVGERIEGDGGETKDIGHVEVLTGQTPPPECRGGEGYWRAYGVRPAR